MTGLDANKYYLYDELTAYLERVADEFPDRARLFSIGESPEGRQIWVRGAERR